MTATLSETCYKATRPDGTDFRTGTIDYAAALATGEVITHPRKRLRRMHPGDASTHLSVSVAPADCTGMRWPCRLFRVEPVGEVIEDPHRPNKRCTRALRVVEELPAWQALGPNGEAVVALIERARTLTPEEARQMAAARAAAWAAARDAAWAAAWAAWAAARDAAWKAAWAVWAAAAAASEWEASPWAMAAAAAWAAASALVVRDLISAEHFETLVAPWVAGVGRTWEVAA